MKRLLFIFLFVAALTGCSVFEQVNEERYSRNNRVGENWLSDHSNPAEINIAGSWSSYDWGRAFFRQKGRRITGKLGDYSVNGVVSGRRVYLLIAQGDWYYYSAILEPKRSGLLVGRYSRAIPFVKGFSRSMQLEKLAY